MVKRLEGDGLLVPKRIGRERLSLERDTNDVSAVAVRVIESPHAKPMMDKPEDRMSLFWRVFGGTILSVAALIGVTLYNNLNSTISEIRADSTRTINELRARIDAQNDSRGDLMRRADLEKALTALSARLDAMDKLSSTIAAIKEQMTALSDKSLTAAKDQKDSQEAMKTAIAALRDKLTPAEQSLKTLEDDRKTLTALQQMVAGMREKSAAQDVQIKTTETESKDIGKQITDLRERLTRLEARIEPAKKP